MQNGLPIRVSLLPLGQGNIWHIAGLSENLYLKHGLSKVFQQRCVLFARTKSRLSSTRYTRDERRRQAIAQAISNPHDVHVNDLSATLLAHRERNRNAVIRKISVRGMRELQKRPLISMTGKPTVASAAAYFQRANQDAGTASQGSGLPSSQSSKVQESALETDSDVTDETQKVTKSSHVSAAVLNGWPVDSMQARRASKQEKAPTRGKASRQKRRSKVLEYEAFPQLPQEPWIRRQNGFFSRKPWLEYMERQNGDGYELLSAEIKAFEAYMKLTSAEKIAPERIASDLNSILNNTSKIRPSISIVGSRSTNLATPISDVDVNVGWNLQGNSRSSLGRQTRTLLRRVNQKIKDSSLFSDNEMIFARVPLVKAKHIPSGLQVEVMASSASESRHECVRAFLQEFPSLRSIYMVLRTCLEIRDLKTVFHGGIGSYCLLMMIVTALKDAGGLYARDDLARQLLHVLHFYATADLYTYGFSIVPPRRFNKIAKKQTPAEKKYGNSQDALFQDLMLRKAQKPYLLCLQDPADDSNDLGKACYAIKHVQATFEWAHTQISKHAASSQHRQFDDQKGDTFSYLAPLLSADYTWFESQRSRLERHSNPQYEEDNDDEISRLETDAERRRTQYSDIHRLVQKECAL